MKFKSILEHVIVEAEEKQQVAALDQAMASAFQSMGSDIKSREQEIQADVDKANVQVNESLTAAAIFGIILAAPKVVELLVNAFSKITSVFTSIFSKNSAKTEEEQTSIAKKIIDFTHKWHKSYIAGIKWVLKVSGLFKKAGIKDESAQAKAAELIYYTLIASLAVYSGISAISAFKNAAATSNLGGFSIGALESGMAAIKTGEVSQFVSKLTLK